MPSRLTILNAEIKTSSVEIKALTVSGKQVTLAVFRQLLSEPILSEDHDLLGIPWGMVNYHPDRCTDGREHLHVVWQKGNELRRSTIYRPQVIGSYPFWAEVFDDFIFKSGRLIENDYRSTWEPGEGFKHDHKDDYYFFLEGLPFRCEGAQSVWSSSIYPPQSFEELKKEHERYNGEELYKETMEAALIELALRKKLWSRWDELLLLPHLFIAV